MAPDPRNSASFRHPHPPATPCATGRNPGPLKFVPLQCVLPSCCQSRIYTVYQQPREDPTQPIVTGGFLRPVGYMARPVHKRLGQPNRWVSGGFPEGHREAAALLRASNRADWRRHHRFCQGVATGYHQRANRGLDRVRAGHQIN